MTVSLIAALLAALSVLALLWSRWPAWMKALLVVGVTAFYFAAYEAVLAIWGLPSHEPLPARFVLLAANIEEPTPRGSGALYLWVTALEDGKPAPQPRAYQIAYTKDLHAKLNDAVKKTRQGVSQMGSTNPKRAAHSFLWLRSSNDELDIQIRDLPVPQLPEK